MANKKPSPQGAEAQESQGFETSLERLEVIVQELEGGQLTLEESLARYEEGVRLSKRLTQSLDRAEERIERLNGEDAPPGTHPVDAAEEERLRGTRPEEGELQF
ncbi:MAG TPA: exodeoxyribonuclease VII small subunit [Candidatus Eisenbacteria bacterium]|nr:exodeoxyribonuclease VII small subunit [Candidatus Eisenbacteria bacterium]